MRLAGWWVAALIGLLLILFGGRLLGLYVDWLWFGELGQRAVFGTVLAAQAQLALAFGPTLFLLMLLNLWLARRASPSLTPRFTDYPLRIRLGRLARAGLSLALLASALGLGGLAALEATAHWDTWLRFRHATAFGQKDPVFGREIGFYVFQLPFWSFLYGRVFLGVALIFAGTALIYYLDRGLEFMQGYTRVSSGARAHLSVLLGILMLVKAWGYRLDAYDLLLTPGGVVNGFGAGYTDIHARLPALNSLSVLAVVAAVGFFLNAYYRLLWLPAASLALIVVASFFVGTVYPAIVQRFQVAPDEGRMQQPYIRHHLNHTRAAYGLDRVAVRDFTPAARLRAGAIARNAVTVDNIRLWDYETLRAAYQSLQSFLQFYTFNDVDIDRYTLNGRYRQVMLSARELDQDRLDATAQRWVNRRLEYTHGYGLVMSPVNESDRFGRPVFLLRDIPLTRGEGVDLAVPRPQIYFGEVADEPVIVRSRHEEFDYSLGGGAQTTRYEGTGGIPLGAGLKRALFASYLGDSNLLLSDAITRESRLLIRRNILDRVRRIAPFLQYDRDPYLVVADGRLVWIHDAYTTAATYPYSQPLETRVPGSLTPIPGDPLRVAATGTNYIRNSVKVVTDAYDGTVRFYVADERDPVVRTYQRAFPSLWRPLAEMPAGLRAHIRYPETVFTIQARMYEVYHVTDPWTYFRRSDLWAVSPEPNFSRTGGMGRGGLATAGGPMAPSALERRVGRMEPYYVIMRLPGERREEFLQILPLNFTGKENMAAWLAARSDGEHYGEIINYVFPRGTQTTGPTQVAAFINQQPAISERLTLWGQQGSRVIWGNLLVIPIENSLLYVVPLFLSASDAGIPEMKQVVLYHGGQVVMEATLEEAIRRLFQGEDPEAPVLTEPPATAATPGAPPAPVPPTIRRLADTAARQLEQAGEAQRRGDWAAYGAALKRLETTLRELRRATGGR